MKQGHIFYPGIGAVRGDIRMGADACDGIAAINSLFERISFQRFGLTVTAHGQLSFKAS